MSIVYSHPLKGSDLYVSNQQDLRSWLRADKGTNNQVCQALYQANRSKALPWLTLVIGSELLAPQIDATPSTIAKAVALRLLQMGTDEDDARESGLFVLSLLLSRRRLDFVFPATGAQPANRLSEFMTELDTPEIRDFLEVNCIAADGTSVIAIDGKPVKQSRWNDWVLKLVQATACLNQVYFFVKNAYQMPINRWEDEGLTISRLGPMSPFLAARWKIATDAIVNARTAVERFHGDESENDRVAAVCKLLGRIKDNLTNGSDSRIVADDLLTLTEVTWYYLTLELLPNKHDSYLSWPEVLLSVGLTRNPKSSVPPKSRPSLSDAGESQDAIWKELIEASTEKADLWDQYPGQEDGIPWPEAGDHPVENAYRAYARLLAAQSEVSFQAYRTAVQESTLRNTSRQDDNRTSNLDRSTDKYWATMGGFGDVVLDFEDNPSAEEAPDEPAEATPGVPPPATAFVTTFDIELELALRHFCPDMPFVVVLPVNVALTDETNASSNSDQIRAATIWLGYVVGPLPKEYDYIEYPTTIDPRFLDGTEPDNKVFCEITNPPIGRWFVVSAGKDMDESSASRLINNPYEVSSPLLRSLITAGRLPFVIRLSGSPLVHLPQFDLLEDDDDEPNPLRRLRDEINAVLAEDGMTASGLLYHALVLEESHSMFLSFPEFAQDARQGLPPKLANYFPPDYWRYWMLLGVQASDNPIRYRLIAQISGVPDSTLTNPERPRKAGMALNRERALTTQAAEVLQWANFDTISGEVTDMTAQLDHYSDHLEANNPPERPFVAGALMTCRIKKGGNR